MHPLFCRTYLHGPPEKDLRSSRTPAIPAVAPRVTICDWLKGRSTGGAAYIDIFAVSAFNRKNENSRKFQAAHLIFFSSFLSFFLAAWLPAAACCASSSALAFFALFSFFSCFLVVGIQLPCYFFDWFYSSYSFV
jgi:hypothetical protein